MLNKKQKKFVAEYLKDLNATQAAKRAGYSDKSAYSQGQRLLKNDEVKEALAKKGKIMEDKQIAEAREVLEMLTRSMRREEKDNVIIKVRTEKVYYDKEGKKVQKKTEKPQAVEVKTKLSDALRAAELLGRYHSLFNDQLELNVDGAVNIIVDGVDSTDERDKLMG